MGERETVGGFDEGSDLWQALKHQRNFTQRRALTAAKTSSNAYAGEVVIDIDFITGRADIDELKVRSVDGTSRGADGVVWLLVGP